MLGAIVGDIIGSVYEFRNTHDYNFPLFTERTTFTDDTVMTIAVADGIMNKIDPELLIDSMHYWGNRYMNRGYGSSFIHWLLQRDRTPYNSFGNGSAMRVSPVGWMFRDLDVTEDVAEMTASVTHNHPEGIKGARATAAAIYLARNNTSKDGIKNYIESTYNYNLSRTLDEIRPIYKFNETCQGTVPEAIIAFLESENFEDAIRKAITLGGDSDTIAAITGSIAEAFYEEIPINIITEVLTKLDKEITIRLNLFLEKRIKL